MPMRGICFPFPETLDYSGVSITAIKREIGEAAGSLLDAAPGKTQEALSL
jgi:hypothetical protein